MPRRITPLLLFILLLNSACSLLQEPQQPILPTPVSTSPPLAEQLAIPEETVFDPVSDVAPAVDPQIANLVNSVSQQQLFAYVQTLQNFGTRHTFSPVDRQDYGLGAARLWIFNEFLRVGNGRLQVEFDAFPLTLQGQSTEQQNIVATLPGDGSYPGVFVLMAHYDSRTVGPFDSSSLAPGANDNASGVAVLLEAARLLSAHQWRGAVVFVAFAAEEQGAFGSQHFVSDRLLDGWLIDGGINNDIVGGRAGIPPFIRIFAGGNPNGHTMQLARYLNLVGGLYVPTFGVDIRNQLDREGRYSDHLEFLDAGVPALRLTESVEDIDLQHNARDTADRIDYGYLAQVARLNLVTTANVIGAPAVPPTPTVAPMSNPGAYLLTWAPDPDAAGYAISFRPVDSQEFAPFRYVSVQEAGNVALTGFDPNVTYAVSLAALDKNGRIGLFSPETFVGPGAP